MTSLDDSIISEQNLMLLENVTDYKKTAFDYFHQDLNDKDICLSWNLLLKMRKHKLLRLPSCSIEDDIDYSMYLQRLHHCLWRRWSIDKFNLNNVKADPLSINWNKETDVTVLYGPDLSLNDNHNNNSTTNAKLEDSSFEVKKSSSTIAPPPSLKKLAENNDMDSIHSDSDESLLYASSVDSTTSSIFDAPSAISSPVREKKPEKKGLRFNDVVKRRDISKAGECKETYISINDKSKFRRSKRHQRRVIHSDYYSYQPSSIDLDIEAMNDFDVSSFSSSSNDSYQEMIDDNYIFVN